jgi:hypothetical protein
MAAPPGKGSRWFAWWYLSLGAGFLLLGANRLLIGDPWWTALLRLGIASGFFLLAWLEMRYGISRRR